MPRNALGLPEGSVRALLAIGSLLILAIVVIWTRGQSGLEALIALASVNGREYWEFAKARLPPKTDEDSPQRSRLTHICYILTPIKPDAALPSYTPRYNGCASGNPKKEKTCS